MIKNVPIEVSARHVHLSRPDADRLFGRGHELAVLRKISQPGQFAAKETVTVTGPSGQTLKVRVVGPLRDETQVELTRTEARQLGIEGKVRLSHDLANTPGCGIVGPRGKIVLKGGVIIARRHLHISPGQARLWKLKHRQKISLLVAGTSGLRFDNVVVESRQGVDELSFMINTDEANAAGVDRRGKATLL